jgi:hypothetical protein
VDRLIIVFGAVAEDWVRERLGDAVKFAITARHPLKSYSVYFAPPRNKSDNGKFKLPLLPVYELQRTEAENFVSIILELAEQRRLPIYFVMTMRSDFLGDCDNFHGLPEAMNRSQYLVPRLTRRQRQQAIEGPIKLFGGAIAPRLLDRVLNDMGDKSDQLPVMQHALMRAYEQWQRSGDPQIDLIHYEAVGAIKDALSNDANGVLETLSPREEEVAMRMFQSLTKIDGNKRRTRRPVKFDKLMAITGSDRQTLVNLILRFQADGRSFILPEAEKIDDNSTIDISHESLIRQWETLRDWTDNEAKSWELYKELSITARLFRDGKHSSLSNLDLEDYQEWREESSPNEAWVSLYETDQQPEFNPEIDPEQSAAR